MINDSLLLATSSDLVGRINNLITLMKALGILAIAYVVWMIVRGVWTLKTNRKMSEMCDDIKKIKKKLKIKN